MAAAIASMGSKLIFTLRKDIAKHYINQHIVRLIALQVALITSVCVWQGWMIPFLLISVDFALRAFTALPSPLAASGRLIAGFLRLPPKLVFAPPKKFAAAVGFVISLIIFLLFALQHAIVAYVLSGILMGFAFLEAAFNTCVGCYVYHWLVAPIMKTTSRSKPLKQERAEG